MSEATVLRDPACNPSRLLCTLLLTTTVLRSLAHCHAMVPWWVICTDPATMQTSISFPRQARPARYMVPANDTCPLPSTMRVTTIPVLAARGLRRP